MLVAAAAVGCREHMPHSFTLGTGDMARTHPEPAEGGYYTNWDPYAATIEVTPKRDVNPVNTQHILIATVLDHDGEPLPNRRVEWTLPEGSVGAFVEVDESGWRASRGYKVTSRFAVTHTNNGDHVLTRGNDDPSDDIHLKRGQTWAVITSPVEGTSHVTAYAPGIYDWDKHKVFVEKHWYDVAWKLPPAATNPVDTPHELVTDVAKYSDGSPLEGYHVTYKILDGPGAQFDQNDDTTITVKTNAEGKAKATLVQTEPKEGTNRIQIDVVRPENVPCCKPAVHMTSGVTTKTWVGPDIAISKNGPASAMVGDEVTYQIAVTNPSDVAATDVKVVDEIPGNVEYVSSDPEATRRGGQLHWDVGELPAKGRKMMNVTFRATETGRIHNCATVTAAYGLRAEDCADTQVAVARLTMRKTAPEEVLLCDPITYEVIVTNEGSAPATNVRLTDDLPDGLTYEGHGKVTSNLGTIQPGASKRVRYDVKAAETGTYTNKASVTGDRGLSASADVKTVVRQPVLTITKEGPETRLLGREITYTITVANKGDGDARNTTLVDTLPTNAEFVNASDGGTMSRGKVTWNLGTLRPDQSREVTVTLRATAKGEVRNVASVRAYCAEADGEIVTEVEGIPAILLECVDTDDPIEVGANTTYVITVTNQGSAVGTGVVITCTLAPEQQLVSADGETEDTVDGKKVTFAPIDTLAVGAEAVYRIVVKGERAGDVRFEVSLTSDQMTRPAMETEATRIYAD